MELLLSLSGGLGLLALVLVLIAPLAPAAADGDSVRREILVIDPSALKPEPIERFLYASGVLLLPFCLGGAYLGVRRIRRTTVGGRFVGRLAAPAAWVTAPLLLLVLATAVVADERAAIKTLIPGGTMSLVVAAALGFAIGPASSGRLRERACRLVRVPLWLLAAALLLGVLAFSILGPEHIRDTDVFYVSFNAVFHSVVQVFLGKELLADFTNQYGLYPHFLEPVFRLVGLSVVTFTTVMGLLTCLAFLCLYRFLARETADELLAFLGLATLLFFGYVAGRVEKQDLYLQYHPLRLLFPAISVPLARAFAREPAPRRGALLLAVAAAAALWNPDSGGVALIAGFLLLAYDALLRRRPRELPRRLLLGAAAAIGVCAAFSFLLRLRYGAFPDYARLFEYARVFYLYGLAMLPLPRFGLWVPVVAVYAAGLLLAVRALVEGEDTPRVRLLFYLAVLGLGLFTYYQGRSSLGNLLCAGYPALLLLVLFASDLRRCAASRAPAAVRLLSVTVLALLAYSLPALAAVAPGWYRGIAWKIGVTARNERYEPLRDAEFLRAYLRPGQQALIVSGHSGLHHLVSGTIDPLASPGTSELLLQRDYRAHEEYLTGRRGTFVVDRDLFAPAAIASIKREHPVFHENPRGSLVVFTAP